MPKVQVISVSFCWFIFLHRWITYSDCSLLQNCQCSSCTRWGGGVLDKYTAC